MSIMSTQTQNKLTCSKGSIYTGHLIKNGLILGSENSGEYWIEDGFIWGPRNAGKYRVKNNRIYGPKNSGEFYINGHRIYGPSKKLPWL